MKSRNFLIAASLVAGIATITLSVAAELTDKDWLLKASTSEERFRMVQTQLRGLDQPMLEIGQRYLQVYAALERENYDLAAYHWKKIGLSLENAIVKRPARVANSNALFLDHHYDDVMQDLESRDKKRAWEGFAKARGVCIACHVAENVQWMNAQPMFEIAPPK